MAFTNFAVPLLEGKTDAWNAACVEIKGSKKELYLASRRNLGITKGTLIENGTVDVILSFKSSPSQDLVGYRIYRSTNQNETGEIIDNMESEALYLSYRDVKVSLGATYYYSVVAVDRMGFESEAEVGFIDLVVEEEPVVKSSNLLH